MEPFIYDTAMHLSVTVNQAVSGHGGDACIV